MPRVVRILNRKNTARMRRRIQKLKKMATKGGRTGQDVENSYTSWKSHAEMGNSHNKIRRMLKWLTE